MQINPLLSSYQTVTQPVQPAAQTAASTQQAQAPVQTQTTSGVTAVGQSQDSSTQSDSTQKQHVDDKELNTAVKQLNDTAAMFNTQIQFSVDPDTGKRVVQVVDTANNEVVSQIPSEEALRLSKALGDFKGLLVTDKA